MNKNRIAKYIGTSFVFLVTSCTLPSYLKKTENKNVPANFSASAQDSVTTASMKWKDFFKDPKIGADVGMDERRIDVDDQGVSLDRGFVEADQQRRSRRHGAQYDDLKKMHPCACDPIHGFRRVVHGVEAP